jgi:hypothetical protein
MSNFGLVAIVVVLFGDSGPDLLGFFFFFFFLQRLPVDGKVKWQVVERCNSPVHVGS